MLHFIDFINFHNLNIYSSKFRCWTNVFRLVKSSVVYDRKLHILRLFSGPIMVIPSELITESIAVDAIWNCIYKINYHKYYQNLWVLKTAYCILSFTPERQCLENFPQETKFLFPNFGGWQDVTSRRVIMLQVWIKSSLFHEQVATLNHLLTFQWLEVS